MPASHPLISRILENEVGLGRNITAIRTTAMVVDQPGPRIQAHQYKRSISTPNGILVRRLNVNERVAIPRSKPPKKGRRSPLHPRDGRGYRETMKRYHIGAVTISKKDMTGVNLARRRRVGK